MTSNFRRPAPLATANPFATLDPDVSAPYAAHVGAAKPEHGYRTKARCHPSRARCARRRLHQLDHVGTLNTRNLGTKDAGARLNAITDMMLKHRVGVLVVQETKVAHPQWRQRQNSPTVAPLPRCKPCKPRAGQASSCTGLLKRWWRIAGRAPAPRTPLPRASLPPLGRAYTVMPQLQTYIFRSRRTLSSRDTEKR